MRRSRTKGRRRPLPSSKARLEADIERGLTGAGPHLHDLRIEAGGRDLRVYGSQGEQRVAVLSLVLAEAELLRERLGVSPLVLLDDVLSELDGIAAARARRGDHPGRPDGRDRDSPRRRCRVEPARLAVRDAGTCRVMERIGDQIEHELARSGSRDAIPLGELTAAWPEMVGDAVARNAWPLRIARDGTLHVATASATWAHELDLLQDDDPGRAESPPWRRRSHEGALRDRPDPRAGNAPGVVRGRPFEAARRAPGGRVRSRRSGCRDRRRGAPRAGRACRSSEPAEGPVRPPFLVDLHSPAIWRFAGLF